MFWIHAAGGHALVHADSCRFVRARGDGTRDDVWRGGFATRHEALAAAGATARYARCCLAGVV